MKLRWEDWAGEDWEKDANCRGSNPDLFFTSRGVSHARSREICASCTVSVQCKEFAVKTNQVFGYWGSTADERITIRRQRKLPIDPGFAEADS